MKYDYDVLIDRLENDINEGLTDETVYVIRDKEGVNLDRYVYYPVVDYYFDLDDIDETDDLELVEVRTDDILAELNALNDAVNEADIVDYLIEVDDIV